MDKITLYEEYRLIERNDSEISGAWKSAHLLLLFLAFVFGSLCTFCFHLLMYMFDEKCVLFPKLLSLSNIKHSIIFEFIPEEASSEPNMLPVDFLSTQWVEKSVCYLPTYVPLVSAIFGLVWTTMFLMCTTGSRTFIGLQRQWRVLMPVTIFSLAMGGLCLYATIMTHAGLHQLCLKLGEITGSTECTYTVNVATLTYERRIRGVYQATRLTILSAWLHTCCWLFSAILAIARVLLAVDFQLVCVSADLIGDLEKMLERNEKQLLTVTPFPFKSGINTIKRVKSTTSIRSRPVEGNQTHDMQILFADEPRDIFFSATSRVASQSALLPEEQKKLERLTAYRHVPKHHKFIVKMLYDFLDKLKLPKQPVSEVFPLSGSSSMAAPSVTYMIRRQHALERLQSSHHVTRLTDTQQDMRYMESEHIVDLTTEPSTSKGTRSNMQKTEPATQTSQKVQISESPLIIKEYSDDDDDDASVGLVAEIDKETQTPKKEKEE